MRSITVLLCCLLLSLSCSAAEPDLAVGNLRAFTKLYGYVRYFHPSDEAAGVDWDRFAIHGAKRVVGAKTSKELRSELEKLFLPIAPSIQFFGEGEKPQSIELVTGDDLEVVAWQHAGVGLGVGGLYRSARLNREGATPVSGAEFGGILQQISAVPLRGKEVRFSARGKAAVTGDGNQLQFWIRVDRPDRRMGFFENMDSRPVRTSSWKSYEINGNVAADAERIAFGAFLAGTGRAWVDGFRLEAREPGGEWSEVAIANPTFEADKEGELPAGWQAMAPGFRFSVRSADPGEGTRSVLIEREVAVSKGALFESHPKPGEFVDAILAPGLRARIPLALYSREHHTLPRANAEALAALNKAVAGVDLDALTAADRDVRLGNVVIAWNVFQHFYPYFDVVKTDWDAVLTRTLKRALTDETPTEFRDSLRGMVAELHDGHGNVIAPKVDAESGGLPILVAPVEGKVVVIAVAKDAPFQIGDVIVSIDGEPAEAVLGRLTAMRSGSPQWKRASVARHFGAGPRATSAKLVVDRAGKRVTLEAVRASNERLEPQRPANFSEVASGVIYVDLSTAEWPAIDPQLDKLASARGVIFDVRGYPKGNHDILRHLTADTLRSARWQVPLTVYPDRQRLVGYDESGRWTLEPKKPRFGGRIVFLTGGGAISYAESVMGIVEHYKLGTIVGGPTAGANGNVNLINLPGSGFRITFTGMRVVKHDGSQHHLVGIQPDVAVEPTIAGIRAGRDEVLEKGVEVVKSGA